MFPFLRLVLRRTVIVNLDDGTALHGVMYRKAGPLLVLKNAQLLEEGAEPLSIDGDAIIERSRVLYIQAI
jgi:hypothetical protein